jgi:omega-6 fatty acid desaturase (delta-12 desaturase)
LQNVLRDNPELRATSRLSLTDSVRCIGLSLWDEASQKLVSFKNLKQARPEVSA